MIRIIKSWQETDLIAEGEVYVVDVAALNVGVNAPPPCGPAWSVDRAGERSIAWFFQRSDALRYAERLQAQDLTARREHEHDCLVMEACINANEWLSPAEARRAKAFIGLDLENVTEQINRAIADDDLDGSSHEGGRQ